MHLNLHSDLIQDYADLTIRTGDEVQARQLLRRLTDITMHHLSADVINREVKNRAAGLRYLWFELNQQDLATELPVFLSAQPESVGEYRSCDDADLSAKLAIIRGNRDVAGQQVDYLQARHYRHPGFMRFCNRYQLCAE